MHPIRLLSTDFDGTLVGFEPDQEPPDTFLEWLDGQGADRPTWIINTGRWIDSIIERLHGLEIPREFWPAWVASGEREIYRLDDGAYQPLHPWNADCETAHVRLAEEVHHAFALIRGWVGLHTNAVCLYERASFAGLRASTEDEADRVSAFLEGLFAQYPDLAVQRNDVYFRFCHRNYHKGACLAEIQRLIGATPAHTFACGDHFNDLPMLRADIAAMLACPINAIPEVRAAVAGAGGHVATRQFTDGLVEALEAFSGAEPAQG